MKPVYNVGNYKYVDDATCQLQRSPTIDQQVVYGGINIKANIA
jgi:hypothetical protein